MRILIANAHADAVGGVESYLSTVLPALAGNRHELAFLHTHRIADGAEPIGKGIAPDASWCVDEIGVEAALGKVERWLPEVVYSHSIGPVALEAALLRRYPGVFFAHGYLGTCISGRKCFSFPRFQPCSRELGPACLPLYGVRRCGGLSPVTAWSAWQEQTARKRLLPQYARVLVASDHMRGELIRNGAHPRKVQKAALPVFGRRAAVPRSLSHGRLLMIGRLTDLKGGAYLLEALSAAEQLLERPLRLRIAGIGSEQPRLQAIAASQRLNVEFCGWVGSEQRTELLMDSDLLVVPSVWPEPFGLVGVEAGLLGVPAAAFDVGGVRDWLTGGLSGELADGDPPTPVGLAQAIARALRDPQHYARLSAGALASASRFQLAPHLDILENALAAAQVDAACVC